MTSTHPPWWSNDLPSIVQNRGSMPDVDRLQTLYVKYSGLSEAIVAGQGGWELTSSLSRRTPEQCQAALNLPTSINMRIVEAPAEFCAPVKQDKRLTPPFRVRMEVSSQHSVQIPITLRAQLITQQQKDNILRWSPDDPIPGQERALASGANKEEKQTKSFVELKGNTILTHEFTFNLDKAPANNYALLGHGADLLDPTPSSNGLGGGGLKPRSSISNPPGTLPSQHSADGMFSGMLGMLSLTTDNLSGGDKGGAGPDSTHLSQAARLGGSGLSSPGADWGHKQHQGMWQGGYGNGWMGDGGSNPLAWPGSEQQLYGGAGLDFKPPRPTAPSKTLAHTFEFTSVELLKPTRMNKVYMVFSCIIGETDQMTLVYHIPTIGICRAEQRLKALQKLGLPQQLMQALDTSGSSTYTSSLLQDGLQGESGGGARHKRSAADQWAGKNEGRNHMRSSQQLERQLESRRSLSMPGNGVANGHLGPSGHSANGLGHHGLGMGPGDLGSIPGVAGLSMPPSMSLLAGHRPILHIPLSAPAMREWIIEEYKAAGFKRKLLEQDLQALLILAGYPIDPTDGLTISEQQYNEFRDQWLMMLSLLRNIANLWNLDDPCVISGFDMDRLGTVHALANEPPGTFIVRFSMSQAASLVLSCKMQPDVQGVDSNHLLHAIIPLQDLAETRVETWIRDFQGATHVLDVYRQKRVDKRTVLSSLLLGFDTPQLNIPSLSQGLGFGSAAHAAQMAMPSPTHLHVPPSPNGMLHHGGQMPPHPFADTTFLHQPSSPYQKPMLDPHQLHYDHYQQATAAAIAAQQQQELQQRVKEQQLQHRASLVKQEPMLQHRASYPQHDPMLQHRSSLVQQQPQLQQDAPLPLPQPVQLNLSSYAPLPSAHHMGMQPHSHTHAHMQQPQVPGLLRDYILSQGTQY